MTLQGGEEVACEAKVARHELGGVLRPIHACKVEYEVRLRAHPIQILRRGLNIALHDLKRKKGMETLSAVLSIANRLEGLAKVTTDEALGTSNQNAHYCTASCSRPSRASCTYSAVLILVTVPAISRRSVL